MADWIQVWTWILTTFITLWIGLVANWIAHEQKEIASQQTQLMNAQTAILETQTTILRRQTEIEDHTLNFEQSKFGSEIAMQNEDKMNAVLDKIQGADVVLAAVHNKVREGIKVESIQNLDRYVSEFEEVGGQFCKWSVQKTGLIRILKNQIKYACGNMQIYLHYTTTKSGFSALCQTLFPSTQGMAKFANPDKCPILNN